MTRNKAVIIANPAESTITITRHFDAPRELVFDVWTKPEHVTRWWGCEGSSVPECEIDLRPGGSFRLVMYFGGAAHPISGVYQEIIRPEKLVHTQNCSVAPWEHFDALVTVLFDDENGKTKLTHTYVHSSVVGCEEFIASGMNEGTNTSMDSLEKLLEELQQTAP